MRSIAVPLAALGLVVTQLLPASAQSSTLRVYYHPGPSEKEAYQIAEAYPGSSQPHPPSPLGTIYPNTRWTGAGPSMEDNIKAVPGIFALETAKEMGVDTFRLNANAFATCGSDEVPDTVAGAKFVQSYRMQKVIPGSQKCPGTYPPYTWYMFGRGIRTWWTLNYTQPGTRFIVEVTVRCKDAVTLRPRIHIDRWTWEVVADLNTLLNVVHLEHSNAISTCEIPCIVGEDLFCQLVKSVGLIQEALSPSYKSTHRDWQVQAQNALFEMEGLILSTTAFGDFVEKDLWFPNGPPSNMTADQLTPFGLCGIIDSKENPCACKLIVDLEYIGTRLGIVSP